MKKILYLPSLNMPVYYHRIEAYANTLVKFKERCAVHVVFLTSMEENVAWDKICIGFGEQSDRIQHSLQSACQFYDILVFQKIQNKEGLALIRELKLRFPGVQFVAEIDDAIGEVPPSNIHYEKFKEHHKWSAQHVVMSDAVITSTEYLKNELLKIQDQYNKEVKSKINLPIHVAPNCIDFESWKWKTNKTKFDEFRIGYVAGAGHDEDLLIAYKAIVPLLDKDPKLKFVIRYGGCRPEYWEDHPQIDFQRVNWHISVYPQKLYELKLDIALGCLRDTNFNRCKSNLRWLEFASIGVPIVASNVEPFTKTNGLIYLSENNPDTFREKINECINDVRKDKSGIRKKLQKECKKNYNIYNECSSLLDFFETL